VENLHAISHFKSETFSMLQYAMDFGTITKESLKRATKWSAKYFTHPSSYYPIPMTGMPFTAVKCMSPLPAAHSSIQQEDAMKEWMDNFRPVRQRTVRSETTKDKAGALPPAVYTKQKPSTSKLVTFPIEDLEERKTITNRSNFAPPEAETSIPASAVSITFVSENDIPRVATEQVDEYDTDSDADDTDSVDEGKFIVTRSGRKITAAARFDN